MLSKLEISFYPWLVGIIKEASIDEFREDATIVSLEG